MALICIMTSFSVSAAGINDIIVSGTDITAIGVVDYVDGVDKAHIILLNENKTLNDIVTASNPMEAMAHINDVAVNKDGSYSAEIGTDGVSNNQKVIVSYNGMLYNALIGDYTNYGGNALYIAGNVNYAEGVDKVAVKVVKDGAEIYSEELSVNKQNGAYYTYFESATEITNSDKIVVSYNGASEEKHITKANILKIVNASTIEAGTQEANAWANKGFSALVKLPSGKINERWWFSDAGKTVNAPANGIVIFQGNDTTLSLRKEIPFSAFKQVRDSETLARLSDNAKGKVYKVDLTALGIDKVSVKEENINGDGRNSSYNVDGSSELFLNGKAQLLSKYPNIGYIKLSGVSATKLEDGQYTLSYSYGDAPVTKWAKASDIIMQGYIGTDWHIDSANFTPSAINTANKTISFTDKFSYEPKDGGKYLYRNIIEEIDLPGEWALDNDNNVLYYYMPEGTTASDKLEITQETNWLLSMGKEAKNLWIDGVTLEGTSAATIYMGNADNIKITNCLLKDGVMAMSINNCNNVDIKGNEIVNFKSRAIGINGGGSIDTMEHSNNKISENYIYNCMSSQHNPAIYIDGSTNTVGVEISNNIIHGNQIGYGIRYQGVEVEIANNEIFNVLRYGADAGVIYSGRTFAEYGNVVKNNYIHDYGPIITDFIDGYEVNGIYLDDWVSGQSILGNLIVPNNSISKSKLTGILNFGANVVAKGNVIVGTNRGVHFYDRNNYGQTEMMTNIMNNVYPSFEKVSGKGAYNAKYPQLLALKSDIDQYGYFRMINNTLKDNLGSGLAEKSWWDQILGNGTNGYDTSSDTAFINGTKEAVAKASDSDFVDASNGDYRVKSTSSKYKEFMPNENTKFGFEGNKVSSYFKTLYPANGSYVKSGNFTLFWEQGMYADNYEYQIAKDANFSSITKSGSTNERGVNISGLANGTYYVRIKATNLSSTVGNTWYSDVTTFTVGAPEFDLVGADAEISGTTATVGYTFYNNGSSTGSYKLVVAVYENSGELKAVKYVDVDKNALAVDKAIDFEQDLTGCYVKAFIWADMNNIKPLVSKIIE